MDGTGEHELVAIAAELERYWADQWRRAKEICDLLERRLAGRPLAPRPELRLVDPSFSPAAATPESSRPDLKLVDV